MTIADLIARIVEVGVQAAERDYSGHKRDGAVAGFKSCLGKNPAELEEELRRAEATCRTLANGIKGQKETSQNEVDEYWFHRCYAGEVEWVCNVVSAVLQNEGLPTIIAPTARGVIMANRLLREG